MQNEPPHPSAPGSESPVTDTIPRLHRVVDHARDQLAGLDAGQDTFEACRQRYLHTQQRLQREGRGRATASRIGDAERNWAPTRDCLQELMRWGAVTPQPLPSERKFLDRYREHHYELTDRGRQMAEAARTNRAVFTDEVATCLIEAHPYLQRLLEALAVGRITLPLIGDGDIGRGRKQDRKLADWAAWGAERISGEVGRDDVERELRRALGRFRNRTEDHKPTDKELAEAMSDGFAVAGFAARGAPVDATSIRTFLRWGPDLLLYDFSRHVPGFPQTLVLWGCSDLSVGPDGRRRAARRGNAEYGDRVATSLVASYHAQAADAQTSMATPFIAIHQARAQAAEQTGVTRALASRVLADLVDGAYAELSAAVAVFVGSTTTLPDSEPTFRYRGGRRMVMQVTSTQDAPTNE